MTVSMSESLANALETYVHEPDASFTWKRTKQKKINDATLTYLELNSQTWRGHVWSHHLLVVRPTTLRQADVAMLFITGGSYNALSSPFSTGCRINRSTMVARKTR